MRPILLSFALAACAQPQPVDTDLPTTATGAGTTSSWTTTRSYAGGYPIDSCTDSIQGEGYARGDIVSDVSRLDQHDQQVFFHDFCDHVLLVISDRMTRTEGRQELLDMLDCVNGTADPSKVVVVQMFGGDMQNQDPDVKDLAAWADIMKVTIPVVSDPGFEIAALFADNPTPPTPSMTLIEPGSLITVAGGLVDCTKLTDVVAAFAD